MPSVVLQVPKNMQGSLIGRGGSVIRRLQSEYEVTITIPGRESESREVVVVGPTDEALAACKADIESILGISVGSEPLVHIELDVPAASYGAIIGRGGSVLKSIEGEFHVHLNVPRGDGNVTVEGDKEAVLAARERISELIRQEVPILSGLDEPAGGTVKPKINLVAKPICESLFFPDTDGSNGWNFERFLSYVEAATTSIDICVFTITDNRIVAALLAHHTSGVKVRIITDNDTSNAQGSDIDHLKQAGIPVLMDKTSGHMHHKFAVLDNTALLNGSYNWTMGASQANHENMTIVNRQTAAPLIDSFAREFNRLWQEFS